MWIQVPRWPVGPDFPLGLSRQCALLSVASRLDPVSGDFQSCWSRTHMEKETTALPTSPGEEQRPPTCPQRPSVIWSLHLAGLLLICYVRCGSNLGCMLESLVELYIVTYCKQPQRAASGSHHTHRVRLSQCGTEHSLGPRRSVMKYKRAELTWEESVHLQLLGFWFCGGKTGFSPREESVMPFLFSLRALSHWRFPLDLFMWYPRWPRKKRREEGK